PSQAGKPCMSLPLRRLALLAGLALVAAFLFPAPRPHAEEPRVFTQKPEAAPAQVRGAPAPAAEAPRPKLFSEGPTPYWIWGADIKPRYFPRKEFTGGTAAARLRATCDNHMTVYLNGQEVVHSDEWERPVELDVQKFLKPGANELLAEVVNDD